MLKDDFDAVFLTCDDRFFVVAYPAFWPLVSVEQKAILHGSTGFEQKDRGKDFYEIGSSKLRNSELSSG